MKRKIIFASHERLADGMKKTVDYIISNNSEIETISAYLSNVPIEEEVEKIMQDTGGREILIFTDLLGGSVNQAFIKYLDKENVHLFTGMNLPLIMTILLNLTEEKLSIEQIHHALEESKNQVIYVNDYLKSIEDEDDE